MKLLAGELGGSVSLGLRDRTRMIYVETAAAATRSPCGRMSAPPC